MFGFNRQKKYINDDDEVFHQDFLETNRRHTEKHKEKALALLPHGAKCTFIKRIFSRSYYQVSLDNGLVISRDRYPHIAWGKAYCWALENIESAKI